MAAGLRTFPGCGMWKVTCCFLSFTYTTAEPFLLLILKPRSFNTAIASLTSIFFLVLKNFYVAYPFVPYLYYSFDAAKLRNLFILHLLFFVKNYCFRFYFLLFASLTLFAPSAVDPRFARMTGASIPLCYTIPLFFNKDTIPIMRFFAPRSE
jgi:hypothetical protein